MGTNAREKMMKADLEIKRGAENGSDHAKAEEKQEDTMEAAAAEVRMQQQREEEKRLDALKKASRPKYIAVLEGLRERNESYREFVEVTTLDSMVEWGEIFVEKYMMYQMVPEKGNKEQVGAIVKVINSAYGFVLIPEDEEEEEPTSGGMMKAVRLKAAEVVNVLARTRY